MMLSCQKKKDLVILGWIGFCVIILFVTFLSPYFAFLILGCVVWLYPKKGEPVFKNRLKDFRNYKLRVGGTLLAFIIFSWISSSLREQRLIEQYPLPKIQIVSSQNNQGDNTEYLLEIEAEDYEEIRANSRLMEASDDGKLNMTIQLNNPKTTIMIVAKNKYKTTKKEIVVSRDETEEETIKRLAREEEKRIKAEEAEKARLAEAERQKEIQAEELREYKEIQAREQREHKEIEKNGLIGDLKNIQENIRNFQTLWVEKGAYESPTTLTVMVGEFNLWGDSVLKAKNSDFEDAKALGGQVEKELVALQKLEFPKMRKAYGKIAGQMLWEHDVDVKVFGTANGTIELVGHWFVLNKNIKDSHEAIREMLLLLRFDRANYKWAKIGEYTYFTLDSKADSEI